MQTFGGQGRYNMGDMQMVNASLIVSICTSFKLFDSFE